MACIGARRVSGGLPDAALRVVDGIALYNGPLALFRPRHQHDDALVSRVATMVDDLAGPQTKVHAPLGAGRHVDHQIVRDAVESRAHLRERVVWYEDFPYSLRSADVANLEPAWEPVEVEPWLEASLCYASQIPLLFGSARSLIDALLQRASSHGRESGLVYAARVWSRPLRREQSLGLGASARRGAL